MRRWPALAIFLLLASAPGMLVPYAARVSFAAVLNAAPWRMNGGGFGR